MKTDEVVEGDVTPAEIDAAKEHEAEEKAESAEQAAEVSDDAAAEKDAGDETDAPEEEQEADESHRSPRAEKRIAELTGEKKALETRAADLEAKVKDFEGRAGEVVGLHPSYLSQDEHKLLTLASDMEARAADLLEHFDGIESDDPKKARTAAQVRSEYAKLQAQMTPVVAKANEVHQAKLKQQLEDMAEGRKLREAKATAAKGLKSPPAGKPKAPPVPPRGPAKGFSARPGTPTGKGGGMNVERFEKAGGTFDAAVEELKHLVG
jgi:hypothetical protein